MKTKKEHRKRTLDRKHERNIVVIRKQITLLQPMAETQTWRN
jgi:hypothetical protein